MSSWDRERGWDGESESMMLGCLSHPIWCRRPAEPMKPSVSVEIVRLPVFAGLDSGTSLGSILTWID